MKLTSKFKSMIAMLSVVIMSAVAANPALAAAGTTYNHDNRMTYVYLVFGAIFLVLLIWAAVAASKKK